jgi:hypothetical protein
VDLSAGGVSLQALDSPGGCITSLRCGDVEWLAAPVRSYPSGAVESREWGDCHASGWDECFPNVAAGPSPWEADHGDVWRRPTRWSVRPERTSALGLTEVDLPGRTYRFGRDVRLTPSSVVVDYQVRNDGDGPLPWAWAQHAMLAADDETALVLPHEVGVRVESTFGRGQDGPALTRLLRTGRLDTRLDLAGIAGRAVKMWLLDPLPAWIAVVRPGGWLAWDLAASSVPHVGVWLNRGGWDAAGKPLDHVGVEPSFGCSDDPVRASADRPPLAPGERADWRTVLRLGHDTSLLMK